MYFLGLFLPCYSPFTVIGSSNKTTWYTVKILVTGNSGMSSICSDGYWQLSSDNLIYNNDLSYTRIAS